LGPIDLASEINRWLAAEVYAAALITPIVDALATLMACGRAVDARSLRPYCIATRKLFYTNLRRNVVGQRPRLGRRAQLCCAGLRQVRSLLGPHLVGEVKALRDA